MDEFREVVTVLKPKVIGIQNPVVKVKVKVILIWKVLPHRDDRRRGVTLYIENGLLSAPCTELSTTDFESSI